MIDTSEKPANDCADTCAEKIVIESTRKKRCVEFCMTNGLSFDYFPSTLCCLSFIESIALEYQ